jgi:stress response protein SCP2
VAGDAPLDVAALLCTASGKVRSDDDFVFYGAPDGPGVRHRGAGNGPDGVELDLAAVPPDIAKVVVSASLDGSGPRTFAEVPAFAIVARDAGSGAALAEFRPDGLADETALLCVEVYRRDEAWKLRAVGQGFNSGLAGIATTFGVDIADEAGSTSATPPPPAAPPAGGPNLEKLTLEKKGTVSLAKRQTVSLVKESGPPLRHVEVGLGWDPAVSGRNIDLDASCIVLDAASKVLDLCWFRSKTAANGAVRHSGDNLTGAGQGDDETITVDLPGVPAEATWLVFTVNSYRRQRFTEVANAYCLLRDADTRQELVRYNLTEAEPRTGVFMAALRRVDAAWDMTAIGEFADGRTVKDMTTAVQGILQRLGS